MLLSRSGSDAEPSSALPQPLAGVLADRIRDQIIRGVYAPGSMLREVQLEQAFGSSRGPVRESLRMLLPGGLVEYEARKGFRVREYTKKEVGDIYQLRARLEGYVIDELREKPLDDLIASLQASNERLQGYLDSADIDGYFSENIRFHDAIIRATGNNALISVLSYLNEISLPLRYKLLQCDFESGRSMKYHRLITQCLADGDLDKCQEQIWCEIQHNITPITELIS